MTVPPPPNVKTEIAGSRIELRVARVRKRIVQGGEQRISALAELPVSAVDA